MKMRNGLNWSSGFHCNLFVMVVAIPPSRYLAKSTVMNSTSNIEHLRIIVVFAVNR